MLAGELYAAFDPALVAARTRAKRLLHRLNVTDYVVGDAARATLAELVPHAGENLWIEPPFHCDYGHHIHCGSNVYFNVNCVVLDCAPVLPVTDAAVLARQTDGAVVVVDARRTQVRALAEVDLRLRSAGAAVAGVIINRTARTRSSYYGQRRGAWWTGRSLRQGWRPRSRAGLRPGGPVASDA